MSEYIVDVTGLGAGDYAIAKQEIVRCRDCKHMHVWDVSSIYGNHDHDTVFCLRFVDGMRMTVEPDGFCSWGERADKQPVEVWQPASEKDVTCHE